MKRWILGLLPGALIIGFVGYAWYAFTHAPPTEHHATLHAAPRRIGRTVSAMRQVPATDTISAPPPATAPLIKREEWIIQVSPLPTKRIMALWDRAGRPPLYWSTETDNYYFWINKSVHDALVLPDTIPARSPSWYGKPLLHITRQIGATSRSSAHRRLSPAPSATAPLLQRETWLMQFAQPQIQRQWLAWGRPPLYFATDPGWFGDYYFEPPGAGRNTPGGVTVIYRPLGYTAQHALDVTPWVGKPLHR